MAKESYHEDPVTYTYKLVTSHTTHDVDKLCDLDKAFSWLESVTDVHWYTCQRTKNVKYTRRQ